MNNDPYGSELSAEWAKITAPRADDAPTVVSLFAGGGGSSMGYRSTGFKVRLAVEIDTYPCAAYRLNFPETVLHKGDVTKLPGAEALSLAGLEPRELDVLDGSPPCQGFSTSGNRSVNDPRNSLFRDHVRLLRAFQPRAFVMENVAGMVKGKMKWVFREILRELKAAGYVVTARLMDAQWFGVPQRRKRLIFVGMRSDLGLVPTHPAAERYPLTTAEACPWLLRQQFTTGWYSGDDIPANHPHPTLTKSGASGCAASEVATLALAHARADYLPGPPLSAESARIAASMQQGQQGATGHKLWQQTVRAHTARVSPTITKTSEFGSHPTLISPTAPPRALSVGEVMRLSSFPDEYRFPNAGSPRKTWTKAWAVCGNAVPPMLMRAISREVLGLLR